MSYAIKLNSLLPQTQCTECGYSGCLPYAQAIADGHQANLTLCLPGGQEVADALARERGCAQQTIVRQPESWTADVDIHACIGCNLCSKICPVDAFIGVLNYEHQVIEEDCTGCKLCIPVCPTQCITLKERSLPLPKQTDNTKNIARKSQTQEAVRSHKMQKHHSSLAKLLAKGKTSL